MILHNSFIFIIQYRIGKVVKMKARQSNLFHGLGLLSLTFLISCGAPANPPPPKWTVENPSASTSTKPEAQAAEQKPPAATKSDGPTTSSLEALRRGETTASSGPLKDVNFDFDRAELSTGARETLKANGDWLKANPSARVQIEGHCDERGAEDYNMALGAKRAQAAMEYLATFGIAANRMSTISYGEEIPMCKEKTEVCWAKNRRDRFVLVNGRPAS